MKKIRTSLALGLLISSVLGVGCESNDSQNEMQVHLNIKNMPKVNLVLEEIGLVDQYKIVDTLTAGADNKPIFLKGTFVNSGNQPLYRIKLDNKNILFVGDQKQITITADWNKLSEYVVTTSPASNSLKKLLDYNIVANQRMVTVHQKIDSLINNNGSDSLIKTLNNDIVSELKAYNTFMYQYADTTNYFSNAIYAIGKVNDVSLTQGTNAKNFYKSLVQRFGNKKYVEDFKNYFQHNITTQSTTGIQIGNPAPVFTMTDIKGNKVSLKDYKGKYVLLDFWASWCPPCRKENPNVVNAYRKYKFANFEILGISLDDNREKWMKAIEDDHLMWNHVTDFKGWKSAIVDAYQIEAIPSNFLIDPDGKIIAMNITGNNLDATLSKVLTLSSDVSNKDSQKVIVDTITTAVVKK